MVGLGLDEANFVSFVLIMYRAPVYYSDLSPKNYSSCHNTDYYVLYTANK